MKRITLIASIALILTGCHLRSVAPFFTDDSVLFDERLIADWKVDDSETTWSFTNLKGDTLIGEAPAYKLELTKKGRIVSFLAILFEVDENSYLDLYPLASAEADELHQSHFVSTHGLLKCEFQDGQVMLSSPNYDLVESLLTTKSIAHTSVGIGEDQLLITESNSTKLQALITELEKLDKGFESMAILTQ